MHSVLSVVNTKQKKIKKDSHLTCKISISHVLASTSHTKRVTGYHIKYVVHVTICWGVGRKTKKKHNL